MNDENWKTKKKQITVNKNPMIGRFFNTNNAERGEKRQTYKFQTILKQCGHRIYAHVALPSGAES